MELRWWLDLAAFAGIATLSVPVWSLNFRKKQLARLREADQQASSAEGFRRAVRAILHDRKSRAVADWRRIDEVCLGIGYALLFASAAARLLLG